MNYCLVSVVVAVVSCLALVRSEIVPWTPCPVYGKAANETKQCDINQVRISPCVEAKDGKPCKMYRNTTGSIEFDFTPYFSGEQIGARVYWASLLDIPFLDMNSDGCLYTTCPMEAGKNYTLKYGLLIRESYPPGNYPIKWKVWNEKNDECCFMYAVKLK
nr:PREDICTED: MD-2-related lipid-recognition protein-like [Bemisia tabaci]